MESRQATIDQTRAMLARMRRLLTSLDAARSLMHPQQHALFAEAPIEEICRLEAQLRELEEPHPPGRLPE